MAIHSLHFCRASFLLGQRGLGVPQRGNISLYHVTVKKSQWHSFLLLSVSPLKSFVQTTGWALALFAGNEPFFFKTSWFTAFYLYLQFNFFLQVKQKASRMEFRFRAKNKTFDERESSFDSLTGYFPATSGQWGHEEFFFHLKYMPGGGFKYFLNIFPGSSGEMIQFD